MFNQVYKNACVLFVRACEKRGYAHVFGHCYVLLGSQILLGLRFNIGIRSSRRG